MQVGWGDVGSESVPRLFIHGLNYAPASQSSKVVDSARYVG